MKRSILFSTLIFISVVCLAQKVDLTQKLPVDTSIRVGKLSNGMSYFIQHHDNPKNRAEFFIVHNVGALQEEDNQNGLAHFLEHMAFNGTKNFKGKIMLDYLNKIGVRFGYNVNAYTSKERTVYNISNVPLVREAIIDSVLLMIHDWSFYISCDSVEIEKERGVIREEWRLGDNSRSRIMKSTYNLQYKGSKYALRDVIGDPNVINNFKQKTLVDFYHKWYRPDMQAVVLVGDFDLDDMEKKIKKVFSSIPKAKNPVPKEQYEVSDNDEPIIGIVTDPETKASAVKVLYKLNGPTKQERLSYSSIKNQLLASLTINLVQSKLELSKEEPNSMYRTAAAVLSQSSGNKWFMQFTMSPIKDRYSDALIGFLTDIQRVKLFGFTQQDLEAAKSAMYKKIDATQRKLAVIKNEDLVNTVIEHFTNGDALTSDVRRNEITREILKSITIDEVNNKLNFHFPNKNRIIVVTCPSSDISKTPSEKVIKEIIDSVDKIKVKPFKAVNEIKELYSFPNLSGSKIVKEENIVKYNVKEWTLTNGVKIYWSKNYEPGARLLLSAQSQGGISQVSQQDIASAKLLSLFMRSKGLGNLNDKDLKLFLTDRDASISTSVGLYTEEIGGNASDKDAELMMQLLYLNFVAPIWEKESFDKLIARQKEILTKGFRDPITIFNDSISNILYNNNPYRKNLNAKDLELVTFENLKRIYSERFCNPRDFKFFISGPQNEEEIKRLVEKYIGSIPVNSKIEICNSNEFEIKPGTRELNYHVNNMVTPKSSISIVYTGKIAYTSKNNITLSLLRYVLSDRYLKSIREEKGGAYYVGVETALFAFPENRVSLKVNFDTDPKLRSELQLIVQKEIDDIVSKGPSIEEINDAILYMQKHLRDKQSKHNYLFSRFQDLSVSGEDICDNEELLMQNANVKDVQILAKQIFEQGNKVTCILEPDKL